MNKLHPKPRAGDIVEKIDMSLMFGRVIRIENSGQVKVRWLCFEESKEKIEDIRTLALVGRN